MKIDEHLLKFPKTLPNDDQDFMVYFPYKFPKVIQYYESVAAKYYDKPDEYAVFVDEQFKELEAGFAKINADYQAGNKDDLSFLVETDQRLNKLFCFKFWVINYLFADGPLHEFYVDKLKSFARMMVDVTDDIEEYEQRVIQIQRDLLQTDYADIYLKQALNGCDVMDLLKSDEFASSVLNNIEPILNNHNEDSKKKINELWEPLADRILNSEEDLYLKLRELMELPLNQVRMRNSNLPLYYFLTHSFEFEDNNILLKQRHREIQRSIDGYFSEAKRRFTQEEYNDFELAYKQARNFSMSKDAMGNIDPVMLPVWLGDIHKRVNKICSENYDVRYNTTKHSSMFSEFVWYLPAELKSIVMSVDDTDFSLDTL